jgi:polysaccharide biosynthesis protein PslH
VIKHLSQRHEVTVASLARSTAEAGAGSGLKNHCKSYLMEVVTLPEALLQAAKLIPTRVPFSMGYFRSAPLQRRIREELSRTSFDLLMVHCSSVAQYVEDTAGIPKLLDFGDMDSQKWLIYAEERAFPRSLVYRTEGVRLRRAEAQLARKFGYCTCTTVDEMKTLEAYGTGCKTGWFPNGVDLEYFHPSTEPYEPDAMCFIGRMDYYPNQECMLDFCRHTLPLIRKGRPDAQLFIVGADPSEAILRLSKLPGVTVTGSVPDVRPYVQRCAVNVAPLKIARGTQNKILESLAMGVPVVTTERAASGVDAVPGEHFVAASSREEFAESVVRLLSDRTVRHRFSEAGRARMASHHNWRRSMEMLDRIIADRMTLPA